MERDKMSSLGDATGKMDDTLTVCGCAASPMSMMLSESSTQFSGNGILFNDCRETAPTLSNK
jgi:hypothetical protein